MDLDGLMSRVFGFDGFRPGQREIVETVMAGLAAWLVWREVR